MVAFRSNSESYLSIDCLFASVNDNIYTSHCLEKSARVMKKSKVNSKTYN